MVDQKTSRSASGSSSRVWDAVAGEYDRERASDSIYAACIQQVVSDLRAHGRVLDAGAGTGMATRHIRATEIHALDYSQPSLDRLRQKLPSVATCVADLRAIPFSDNYFDCVLCANALQHLNQDGQRLAADELLRVLKPGGRYSVSAHYYSTGKRRAGWIKEGVPGQPGVDYIYRFSLQEWRNLFPMARIRAVGFSGLPFQGLVTRVFGHMLARFGAGHMLIAYGIKPRRT